MTQLRTDTGPVSGVRDWPPAVWFAGGVLFFLLATANGAGYRYGVSDQAFYVPAVVHLLSPEAFPRDGAFIDAQGRLMVGDEVLAAAVRLTGLPLDWLFLGAYLLSLGLLWVGAIGIGRRLYESPWATLALGAALTLRHRIPRTSANSLEPYFHPRQLAFAFGVLAIAAVLHRRRWTAVALVAAGALVHTTTAIWFSILIGVALVVLDPLFRRLAVLAGVAAAAVAGGWIAFGPEPGVMDETWLEAVASKDSLFASAWPWWAWVLNLAVPAVLWWAWRRRARDGRASAEEAALVAGAAALVAVFIVTLPLVGMRLTLPVQLQISRVFWLVEFLAVAYVIGVPGKWGRDAGNGVGTNFASEISPDPIFQAPAVIALALLCASLARGAYIMFVEQPERPLFAVHLADSPWHDAMRWLRTTPLDTHVLADPGHAWKYGTSVRVSGERDVFLEDVKDSAIAIYSRDVAVRVVERSRALGSFDELTADGARALAARYDLDYLVTAADMPLPLAYRNAEFRIYRLPRER